MKFLLIVLIALLGCDPSGGSDIVAVAPVEPEDPAPVVPDTIIKTAVDVPEYLWDVVNEVWILRLAYTPKNLVASADPYAKFCTDPGSIYTFESDGKITEYVCKTEEYYTMYRLIRLQKDLAEIDNVDFDFIAVPPYTPPYIPANPEPIPPIFTFYILDRDNNIVFNLEITEAISVPQTKEEYYVIARGTMNLQRDLEDIDHPERSPHRWIEGGTKVVELPKD